MIGRNVRHSTMANDELRWVRLQTIQIKGAEERTTLFIGLRLSASNGSAWDG